MSFRTVPLDGRGFRCDPEDFRLWALMLTLGLNGMITPTGGQPSEYSLVVAGVFLSIVPLAALFLSLQRFWRIDLISGGLKA